MFKVMSLEVNVMDSWWDKVYEIPLPKDGVLTKDDVTKFFFI